MVRSCGCCSSKCLEGARLPSSVLNISHMLNIKLHFILIDNNKSVRSQNAAKIGGLCTANCRIHSKASIDFWHLLNLQNNIGTKSNWHKMPNRSIYLPIHLDMTPWHIIILPLKLLQLLYLYLEESNVWSSMENYSTM